MPSVTTQKRGRRIASWSVALTALALVVRYIYGRAGKRGVYSALLKNPAPAARLIRNGEEEYDFDEYDVVVVGGGESAVSCRFYLDSRVLSRVPC